MEGGAPLFEKDKLSGYTRFTSFSRVWVLDFKDATIGFGFVRFPKSASPEAAATARQSPVSLDDIDEDQDMEVEGYVAYEDRTAEPEASQNRVPIEKARLEEALATIEALKAQELGFSDEPPAKGSNQPPLALQVIITLLIPLHHIICK